MKHAYLGVRIESVASGARVTQVVAGSPAAKAGLTVGDVITAFDGKTISLHPSIGSWSLPCRSHYWIRRNRILWAPRWSQARMQRARHARALGSSSLVNPTRSSLARISRSKETSVWSILRKWWLR